MPQAELRVPHALWYTKRKWPIPRLAKLQAGMVMLVAYVHFQANKRSEAQQLQVQGDARQLLRGFVLKIFGGQPDLLDAEYEKLRAFLLKKPHVRAYLHNEELSHLDAVPIPKDAERGSGALANVGQAVEQEEQRYKPDYFYLMPHSARVLELAKMSRKNASRNAALSRWVIPDATASTPLVHDPAKLSSVSEHEPIKKQVR